MGYMFMPLRRFADFQGRSRRKEFWLWQLFNWIVGGALSVGFVVTAWSAIMRVWQRGGITTTSYNSYSYGGSSGFSWEGNIDVDMLLQELGTTSWVLLSLLCFYSLVMFIPALAVAIRRLHDTDRSGWWLFIALIPVIGWIILLVFWFSDGTRGPNRFGHDPKGGYGGYGGYGGGQGYGGYPPQPGYPPQAGYPPASGYPPPGQRY